MDVYIWGDLEFADFVLKGIAAIFATSDGGFNIAAGILLILFFMWSFIKWSLNPEKTTYPVREFVFGIVFWLIFGGGDTSPKFDVTLISERTGYATTVGEVPLLAAVPSWLATNFFRQITLIMDDYFVIPGYENLRNDQSSSDPLAALVKVSELANTRLVDGYVDRTVKDYIKFCYDMRLKLTGASFDKNISDLLEVNMDGDLWATMYVDMELLETYIHTKDSSLTATCPAAHTHIANQLTPPSATLPLGGEFANKALGIVQDAGITPMDIKMGAELINAHLVSGSTVDPYTFTVNLFLASSIKDGVSSSSMQTWADKMVFEASRKRTYEAAGERSLFMKIYIPTITAIEMFSFFIAPVLMILSVLGGFGFSLIGKYLMLVLFINLWGFVKVFVDLYTALSIRRAFQSASGSPGTPFDFQNYAQNFNDIESLLGIASNLTVAIPFFAMFLLYGGVHSVMGVMRTLTNGNVDGANNAPTIATSMNNGATQQADTTSTYVLSGGNWSQSHNPGTNAVYGNSMANSGIANTGANASSIVNQKAEQAQTTYQESLADTASVVKGAGSTKSSGRTNTAADTSSESDLNSITDAHSTGVSHNNSATASVLSRFAATLGVKAAAGSGGGSGDKNAKAEGDISPTTKPEIKRGLMSLGISGDLAGQMVGQMSDAQVQQFAKTFSSAKQDASTRMNAGSYSVQDANSDIDSFVKTVSSSDALTKATTSAQALTRIQTAQTALNRALSNDDGLSQTSTLQFNTLNGRYGANEFMGWYNQLGQASKERLSDLGFGNDATSVSAALHGNNERYVNDGAYMAQGMLRKLNANDDNLNAVGSDATIAASLYQNLAKHAAPVHQPAFERAAAISTDIAKTSAIITDSKTDIGESPNTSKANTADTTIAGSTLHNEKPVDQTNNTLASDKARAGLKGSEGEPIKVNGPANTYGDMHLTEDEKRAGQHIGANNKSALDAIAKEGGALNTKFGGLLSSISDFTQLFGGRDLRWGESADIQSQNVATYLAKTHDVQSTQVSQGLSELARFDTPKWNDLFTKLSSGTEAERYDAATQISRMNDASMLLNTKEGATAVGSAFNDKDLQMMANNDNILQKYLAARTPNETSLSADLFKNLSAARLNGSLTDDNVNTVLKLLTGSANESQDINNKLQSLQTVGDEDNIRALSYMIYSPTSPFSQSEEGRQIAKSLELNRSADNLVQAVAPGNPEQYRDLARSNIINDASQTSILAGRMNEHGDFTPGYNFEDNNQNKNGSVGSYVSKLVSTNDDVTTFNTQQLKTAVDGHDVNPILKLFGGGTSDAEKTTKQEQLFTVATSPHNHANRLEQAGFSYEAERVREGVKDLLDQSQDYNITLTNDQLKSSLKTPDELKELPSISDIKK